MSTFTYTNRIKEITERIFEITCFMFPLEEWEIEDMEHKQKPDGKIRSIVKFDGAAEGGMVISPSGELLYSLASNMLGTDEVDTIEKEGALCEIANIICGNTVPLFAKNDKICVIRPPRIAELNEDTDSTFKGKNREEFQVLLDEGIVDIIIYYNNGGEND